METTAWETGASFAAEGAIRFLLSDDREARRIRGRVAFKPEKRPAEGSSTSMALYREAGILALLMEVKVEYDKTLRRYPTAADRVEFGQGLARCMARAVLAP